MGTCRVYTTEARSILILWEIGQQRGAFYPLSVLIIRQQRSAFYPPSLGECRGNEARLISVNVEVCGTTRRVLSHIFGRNRLNPSENSPGDTPGCWRISPFLTVLSRI